MWGIKSVALFIVAAALLHAQAPPSAVTITGQGGSHTRPITLNRFFAQGEIAHYAKPTVAGAGVPSVWQNDVKEQWRDGSTTKSITGCSGTPIRCTAAGHGFQEGEIVIISGVQGNTNANGTKTVVNVSTDAFDLVNTTTNAVYVAGTGTVVGPGPGSLKQALISFTGLSVPGTPGTLSITFSDSTDPCSSGNAAACSAAGLDAAGMLAFNGGSWTGTTGVTAGGTTYTASARTMLTDGKFTYWQRGPAVTVVVAEDASTSRPYDFGYTCLTNCTTTYATATWTEEITYRSLHPMFVLTFYAGWAGVKVEYILQNMWSTTLKDQRYDLTLSTSAGAVLTTTGLTHYARTQWRRIAWDGSEPGGAGNERAGIKVDYSLAYLIYTKLLLPYDQTMTPASQTATWLSLYNSAVTSGLEGLTCPAAGRCGNVLFNMGTTGARGDIGPISSWDVNYLYTFAPSLIRATMGNADITGLMPVHIREMNPAKLWYDQASTVPAIGMPISVHGRPTFTYKDLNHSTTSASDKVTPIAALSTSHKWTIDTSHFPSTLLVAYLATGDWWYANLQRGITHLHIGYGTGNAFFKRIGYPETVQTRGTAWSLREYLIGSTFLPDATPEKNYAMQKWNYFIAFEDGGLENTDSRFYDPPHTSPFSYTAETSVWGYGKSWLRSITFNRGGWANPLGLSPGGAPECSDLSGLDTAVIPSVYYCGKPFFYDFMHHIMHWGKRAGSPVEALRTAMAPWVIEQVLHPDAVTYGSSNYNQPNRVGDEDIPLLTVAVGSQTTLPFQVDHIPSGNSKWTNPPYVVWMGNEQVKICSQSGLTLTACAGYGSGRAFWGNNATTHPIGRRVENRAPFQTWLDHKRGYSLPLPTDFAWISGISDSYGIYLLAAASGYTGTSVRGYLGSDAFSLIHSHWATNSFGQVTGGNNDPKFMFASDPESSYAGVSVATSALPDGAVGIAYSQTLSASGGLAPFTWAITSGSLPTGLTLNTGSGAITGSPTTVQSATFTARATDSIGTPGSKSLTMAVLNVVVTTTTPLTHGTVGVPYSLTFAGSGGTAPYSWSVVSGSLPDGLSLASGGGLTGTPTAAGVSTFTVRLTDSAGSPHTADLAATLTIVSAPLPGPSVKSGATSFPAGLVKH